MHEQNAKPVTEFTRSRVPPESEGNEQSNQSPEIHHSAFPPPLHAYKKIMITPLSHPAHEKKKIIVHPYARLDH